jgi:hypothetical protein
MNQKIVDRIKQIYDAYLFDNISDSIVKEYGTRQITIRKDNVDLNSLKSLAEEVKELRNLTKIDRWNEFDGLNLRINFFENYYYVEIAVYEPCDIDIADLLKED